MQKDEKANGKTTEVFTGHTSNRRNYGKDDKKLNGTVSAKIAHAHDGYSDSQCVRSDV